MPRSFTTSSIALVAMVVTSASSQASSCPPGYKLECMETQDPRKPPPCRCVPPKDADTGSRGKAEIKAKNLPQVEPGKTPGPND